MSKKAGAYGATFTITDWLKAGQQRLDAGDHASATAHALEAHNRMHSSNGGRQVFAHSDTLGQLCRCILKAPRSTEGKALMPALYTNINTLMIMREHLTDHLRYGAAQPLPAVWSELALSAARQLGAREPWKARTYAELAYANPTTPEANRAELRALALTHLPASLQDGKRSLAEMMYDPLDALRLSGVFARDPAFAATYNSTVCSALRPSQKENQLHFKMLFLLGMNSQSAEAKAIKAELETLLANATPKDAYNALMTGRIVMEARSGVNQPVPDQPTKKWLNASLRDSWNTLCRLTPQEAHYGHWESKWKLPAPAAS